MRNIIVGIDQWEKYTKPAIESLIEMEPQTEIVVVDNISNPPYPEVPGVTMLRPDKRLGYAAALNYGAQHGAKHHDWLFFLNNDILFHKPFIDRFSEYSDDNTIYGFWTHEIDNGNPMKYLPSWAMLIHSNLFYSLGMFDDTYVPMGYEDADICIRATRAGAELKELDRFDFGIEHLPRKNRQKMPEEMYRKLRSKLSI